MPIPRESFKLTLQEEQEDKIRGVLNYFRNPPDKWFTMIDGYPDWSTKTPDYPSVVQLAPVFSFKYTEELYRFGFLGLRNDGALKAVQELLEGVYIYILGDNLGKIEYPSKDFCLQITNSALPVIEGEPMKTAVLIYHPGNIFEGDRLKAVLLGVNRAPNNLQSDEIRELEKAGCYYLSLANLRG